MAATIQSANAVVIISSVVLNSGGPGVPDITFQGLGDGPQSGLSIPGGTLGYNNAVIVPDGTDGAGARPYPPGGNNTGDDYLSVKAGGSATFKFTGNQTTFSFLWGSVDTYNTITFHDGASTYSFTGTQVDAIAPTLILNSGNQGVNGSAFVSFTGNFDKVVLTSTQNSFEIDNVSVPDGGSTLILLGGTFGLLGLVTRKIRK